jgi:hypothetical protein
VSCEGLCIQCTGIHGSMFHAPIQPISLLHPPLSLSLFTPFIPERVLSLPPSLLPSPLLPSSPLVYLLLYLSFSPIYSLLLSTLSLFSLFISLFPYPLPFPLSPRSSSSSPPPSHPLTCVTVHALCPPLRVRIDVTYGPLERTAP